jgi:hypothetical protein
VFGPGTVLLNSGISFGLVSLLVYWLLLKPGRGLQWRLKFLTGGWTFGSVLFVWMAYTWGEHLFLTGPPGNGAKAQSLSQVIASLDLAKKVFNVPLFWILERGLGFGFVLLYCLCWGVTISALLWGVCKTAEKITVHP